MSANYSADLKSRVEPCVFGGTPDCSQCGCAISSGLHWIQTVKVAGPLKVKHFVGGSVGVGSQVRLATSVSVERPQAEQGCDTGFRTNTTLAANVLLILLSSVFLQIDHRCACLCMAAIYIL